jgi:hypothetical protein
LASCRDYFQGQGSGVQYGWSRVRLLGKVVELGWSKVLIRLLALTSWVKLGNTQGCRILVEDVGAA